MNKEIKLRKRRFWAICFVIVFAMIQSIPSSVLAADYTTDGENLTPATTVLNPGDVINYVFDPYAGGIPTIFYCDADANKTVIDSESYSNSSAQSFTVRDYMGTALSADDFKEWKVEEINGSSGALVSIRLVAVSKYTRSTITYVLNGGTNAESNPDSYNEGKTEVILADAEKEGCTFEGWYNDADFTTRVTSIPITQRGPVVLYAKFTANNYNIFYELDGGSNGEGNPDSYTYGIGVASFADAEKEGYTFEGWYSDADFTTRVTSIPITQVGLVELYAKFTANNYNIFYELDGGSNGEGNPDSYTYGIGVASFADAEKEGHTFEGWYADAEFTTQITSIDATQIRDVTLHAKFVEDEEETTTEEESTTEEGTTTEEKTTVEENTTNNSGNEPDDTTSGDTTSNSEQPKTGDSSNWFLWAVLLLISSCGMIGTAVYGKKKKMN